MGSSDKLRHVLVLGDSLTFQGPQGIVAPTDPRLFPNLAAAQIAVQFGSPVKVDLVAREGWTSRDAWWALTKDPVVFGTYLTRASAVIIAVGGMDQLPAVIPTYLREGLPYLRPGSVRRRTRRLYRDLALDYGHIVVAFEPLFCFELGGRHLEFVNFLTAWVGLELYFGQALLPAALGRNVHRSEICVCSVLKGRLARV